MSNKKNYISKNYSSTLKKVLDQSTSTGDIRKKHIEVLLKIVEDEESKTLDKIRAIKLLKEWGDTQQSDSTKTSQNENQKLLKRIILGKPKTN